MTKYVALLRGIGPSNPNMHGAKLCGVLESLGFTDVHSVISSGNAIFESDLSDIPELEKMLEEEWPKQLGFNATTIIRSQKQLQKLVEANPFGSLNHGSSSYLLVTFFKSSPKVPFKLPYRPPHKPYYFINVIDNSLFSVTDASQLTTTDIMTWLEKQFGKAITSRTWLTVHRVLKKMES